MRRTDLAARVGHEVDVAALRAARNGQEEFPAIGEVKWSDVTGLGHHRRLAHSRDLLSAREDVPAERTRLLLFSGAGFTDDLHQVAVHGPDTQLFDLDRLYQGG